LEGAPPGILQPTSYNIVGYTNIGGGGLVGTTGPTAYPAQIMWPYNQQWHLDIQHDLFRNTVGTISYVGSKGTHLIWQRDINQLLPASAGSMQGPLLKSVQCGTLGLTGIAAQDLAVACGTPPDQFRQYTGYNNITLIEPGANSNYNALQMSVRRSVGASIFSLAYTYSHAIDDSSDRYDGGFVNSYNMAQTRGSSNYDVRHLLVLGYVLDAPFFKNTKTLAGKTLGGWQLSGMTTFSSGLPFSVTANNGSGVIAGAGVGGIGTTSLANLIGDPNAKPPITNAANITGPLLYNPAAFAAPTGLTFGDAGRNILNRPAHWNFDMGLFKKFYMTERANFEFRAEAFNVFNHTQFNNINSSISCYGGSNYSAGDPSCLDQSFLHPSSAFNPRILQLGLKFIF